MDIEFTFLLECVLLQQQLLIIISLLNDSKHIEHLSFRKSSSLTIFNLWVLN